MGKDIIIINNHSFVDVITISSTELFVCDDDRSIVMVTEILEDMLSTYNKAMNSELTFEDVFKPVRIGTSADDDDPYYGVRGAEGNIIIKGIYDNSIPYALWELIERAFDATRYHL